jgi:hypothetical protein
MPFSLFEAYVAGEVGQLRTRQSGGLRTCFARLFRAG